MSRLAAAIGPGLAAQVTDAAVVGTCRCGCSSVRLSTSAAPLPSTTVSRLSGTGRPDYVAADSIGRDGHGHVVSAVLHVVEGRLHELEVFDTVAGEGVAVDLAGVTEWERPDVG